ncbi:MAG: hypothetical protein H6Q51_2505 [Deltaproteobacteria bacterium]|nr:hypothetical protein [Deltaproteobacteria bacterium]
MLFIEADMGLLIVHDELVDAQQLLYGQPLSFHSQVAPLQPSMANLDKPSRLSLISLKIFCRRCTGGLPSTVNSLLANAVASLG